MSKFAWGSEIHLGVEKKEGFETFTSQGGGRPSGADGSVECPTQNGLSKNRCHEKNEQERWGLMVQCTIPN